MEFLFNAIGLLVPKKTRDKFVLVNAGRTRGALLEFIDPDSLPSVYGGFSLDTETANADAFVKMDELKVGARQSTRLKFPVTAGDMSSWEFLVKNHDIGLSYGILDESGKGDLCPMVKEEGGRGHLECDKKGDFVLSWDNSHSLLTDKTVVYRVRIGRSA